MIASMRKPAISAALQATRTSAMLMENYELGKVGLGQSCQEFNQNHFHAKAQRRRERMNNMDENQISKSIVDCCYRIHINLGPGLLESVYLEILLYELKKLGLKCQSY